jgi:hypothetical protein
MRYKEKTFTLPTTTKPSEWPKCPAVKQPGKDETRCSHPDGWGHKGACEFPAKEQAA